MNFTLQQLIIFLTVYRQKSISKAAEILYLTQPAISIQMKKFQSQFSLPLTEVIGKKLHFTDFGKNIAYLAMDTINAAEHIKYKSYEYKNLTAGELKISCASTAKYLIPYFLKGFLHKYPSIDLSLDVSNKTRVIQNLKENLIDFAIVSVAPLDLEIEKEGLVENKIYLVNNKPDIDEDDPIILRENGSATRAAAVKYFNLTGKRKQLQLTSNEAVKQAVLAGLGYSIIPIISMKNELSLGQLFIIKRDGLPIINDWNIIWRKDKKLTAVASAFLEYIKSEKKSITTKHFSWWEGIC